MDLQEDERPADVESPPSVKESSWMNQRKSSSKYDPRKMLKIAISNINPYLANLKRQKWIYNMVLSLERAFFLGFCIGCAFFVRDVWNGFQSNDASIKVSKQKIETLEHPTITLW